MAIELQRFESKKSEHQEELNDIGKLFFESFGYNSDSFYGMYDSKVSWYCQAGVGRHYMKGDDVDRFIRLITFLKTLSPLVRYGISSETDIEGKVLMQVAINFPSATIKKIRLHVDKYKNTKKFDL